MGRGKAIAIVGGAVVVAWVAAEAYSIMTKTAEELGVFNLLIALSIFLGGLRAVLGARGEG